MKRGFAILGLTLSLTAHAGKIGGGGGGGGTVKMPNVTPEQVRQAAVTSGNAIITWLAGQELRYLANKLPPESVENYRQIFTAWNEQDPLPDPNDMIFGVIKDLKIEFRADRVCLDKYNHEVEASIYTSLSDKHAICISGLLLARELEEDDYQYKTAAIIVHEATHLMGLGLDNDQESRTVQMDALRGLKNFNFDDPYRTVSTNVRYDLQGILFKLEGLIRTLNTSPHDLHDVAIFSEIDEQHRQLVQVIWSIPDTGKGPTWFAPWHYANMDRLRSLVDKFDNMGMATCVEGTPHGICYPYEKIFNGAPGLYALAYNDMAFHADPHLFLYPGLFPTNGVRGDEYIAKISSVEDLKKSLQDVVHELEEMIDSVLYQDDFEVVDK